MTSSVGLWKVNIHRFQGIPGNLTVDFRPENQEEAHSMILSGDNGTGKSSIVDAIEFALKGRIGRSKSRESLSSAARSLATRELPCIEVCLSDGTTVSRGFCQKVRDNGEVQIHVTSREPHPKFHIAPLVLRRADILRFYTALAHERQLVFLDYYERSDQGREWSGTLDEESERITEERLVEKRRRRELFRLLTGKLGIEEGRFPSDFHAFVNANVYHGISRRSREGQRLRQKTDPEVRRLIREIDDSTLRIGQLRKDLRQAKIEPGPSPRLRELQQGLVRVGEHLTESFCAISPSTFVRNIELKLGSQSDVSLSVRVELGNGKRCSPSRVFSEANLDLLAMLMFLAFAQQAAERGQARVLVLDDVLQSVDAMVRVSVTDYILREFADWQLIVTVHDRLWQEQLRHLFRRHGHPFVERRIVRWGFEDGPTILASGREMDTALRLALELGECSGICSQAGLLLEAICDRLSWTLPTSVVRRKGDKYTLGDLWPGVYKVLRRTNAEEAAGRVDTWMHLRNLVGGHYNEWAQSVATQEAIFFGDAVLEMLGLVRCSQCFRWIEETQPGRVWQCRCGGAKLERA